MKSQPRRTDEEVTPHATGNSEPQEWTPETFDPAIKVALSRAKRQKLADKINAALAAVTKNSTYQALGKKVQELGRLKQQLAAETRRADDSIRENVRLMNRLATAVEALKRLIKAWSDARDYNAIQFAKDALAKCSVCGSKVSDDGTGTPAHPTPFYNAHLTNVSELSDSAKQ